MTDIPTKTAEEIRSAFTELATLVDGVDPDELTETATKLQAGEYVDDHDVHELRAVLIVVFGLGEVLGAEAERFLSQN